MVEIVTAVGAGFFTWVAWRVRQNNKQYHKITALKQADVLYIDSVWSATKFKVDAAGENRGRWQRSILVVSHKRVALYSFPNIELHYTLDAQNLQGFWRPVKYEDGINEIWLHTVNQGKWEILKLRLYRTRMYALVRALKAIATDDQVRAYRQRRPYIHRGPESAYPATQNLQGAWELEPEVKLYIMPLSLVIMRGEQVEPILPLREIQAIAALKRIEGGKPDGLVRFSVEGVGFAFALNEYETFAEDLATAAKRTLEEPLTRKRKSDKYDDDDDDEDYEEE